MTKHHLQFLAAMLIFGSIGLFVKPIPLPSHLIVCARTWIAGIALLLFYKLSRHPLPSAALHTQWPVLIAGGLALGFNWLFLYEAYRHAGVSMGTILYYLAPIIVIALAPYMLGERRTPERLITIAGALLGLALISGLRLDGGLSLRGLTAGLLSALFYAALMLINKHLRGLDGLTTTTAQMLIAAVIMSGYALLRGEGYAAVDGRAIAFLFVLGLFHGAFACYLYFNAMQALPAQSVALMSYLDPLSALLFSTVLLGERLTPLQWLGALLILGATFGNERVQARRRRARLARGLDRPS